MEETKTAQTPNSQTGPAQPPVIPTPNQPAANPLGSSKPPVSGFINDNNRKKIIIIATAIGSILIFILLIAVVFGKQISNIGKPKPTPTPVPIKTTTPTPNPTSDWRVYGNEKYGFQISYPHEFTFETSQIESGTLEYSELNDFKNYTRTTRLSNPTATNIKVTALYTGPITSVAEWLNSDGIKRAPAGTIGPNITNITNTTIAKEDVVTYEDGDKAKRKSVAFYRDGRIIIFSLVPTTDEGTYSDVRESVEYFDNLLSTFRFTDLIFVPIATTLTFDLPQGWKITSETRDRIQVSSSNNSKSMIFYKGNGKNRTQLEDDAEAKLKYNFRTRNTRLGKTSANEFTGCAEDEGCDLVHIVYFISGSEYYLIQYESTEEDEDYQSILDSIEFN